MKISNLKSGIPKRTWQLLGILVLAAWPVSAGTVTGTVRNGTTGAVMPNQDVVLIRLAGEMETVANTKTDAQGRFTLDHPAIGTGPLLIRVPYRGINFHQPLPPGRAVADVEVFEPTNDPRAFVVAARTIIVQPDGQSLLVGEEYSIQNSANPKGAYFKADGNFEFEVPDGAELGQVAAWGPAGMPVTQGTIDKSKNRYAIAYAFRPGESGVRLAYRLPYATQQTTLRVPTPYSIARVSVIAPPTMQVLAAGFTAAGQDQGWNVFVREGVAAGTPLDIGVSGTAPPINEAQAQDSAGQGGSSSGPALSQLPGRLDSLKWPLVAGFAALFALGMIFLWRRPGLEPALAPAAAGAGKPAKRAKTAQAMAQIDEEVGQSLDSIKETLFRLELRRQAGTISEEDYSRERARAEKTLRDFLQG